VWGEVQKEHIVGPILGGRGKQQHHKKHCVYEYGEKPQEEDSLATRELPFSWIGLVQTGHSALLSCSGIAASGVGGFLIIQLCSPNGYCYQGHASTICSD
jgi:hypothetical protein